MNFQKQFDEMPRQTVQSGSLRRRNWCPHVKGNASFMDFLFNITMLKVRKHMFEMNSVIPMTTFPVIETCGFIHTAF